MIDTDGNCFEYQSSVPEQVSSDVAQRSDTDLQTERPLKTGSRTYRLEDLAYTRSGDKGNNSNVGR